MQQDRDRTKTLIASLLDKDSELPAMSQAVTLINQLTSSDETSVTELAGIILKDYGMTNKLLKLVNTVTYLQFGEVTTVSRAVTIMGFENIRNIALSIKVFEHLQKQGQTAELRELIAHSLYSAVLSMTIASETTIADREEAFICALFHTLGKMIVTASLPEKAAEIKARVLNEGMRELEAARQVMGVSFQDIGMGLAEKWNFPEQIIASMRRIHASELGPNPGAKEKLVGLSNISNDIAEVLVSPSPQEEKSSEVSRIIGAYKGSFKIPAEKIGGYIAAAIGEIADYSRTFKLGLKDTDFSKQLTTWPVKAAGSCEARPAPAAQKCAPEVTTAEALKILDTITGPPPEETPETVFTKGLQEVTSALFLGYELNDVLRIVLETIYRAMKPLGIVRVVFLIKDMTKPELHIRFGFGNAIDEMKKWFIVPLGDTVDIFNLSMAKQRDIVIQDPRAADIQALLPPWYRAKMIPGGFVTLLPISISGRPIGLFYAEGEKVGDRPLTNVHVNYLKILRDQTVLAIRQKK